MAPILRENQPKSRVFFTFFHVLNVQNTMQPEREPIFGAFEGSH